jgi:hypothetical protein
MSKPTPAPAPDVAVVNAHPHTKPLAWYVRPSSQMEPVAGTVPMHPPRVSSVPLYPGLNYIPAASLEAATGSDLDKLPPGITVEQPTELRGRFLDEVIASSNAPALRRWLGEDKRPDVKKKIEERLSAIETSRAQAAA